METRPTSVSLAWFLLLAMVFHAFLLWLKPPLWNGKGIFASRDKPKEKRFIIEPAPKLDSDKPVVQTSKAREDEKAKDEKPRYAGEFRNRVEKETQSPRRGRFSEGMIARSPGSGESGALSRPEDSMGETSEEKKPPPGLGMRELLALSSSPSYDKSVSEGQDTVLNTDTVVYASFLNRISDAIYDPWVEHVKEAVRDIAFTNRKLTPSMYITRLTIQMDATGTVTAIKLLESSGVPEIDDAPKKAFWERSPFPNPPEQMLGKDGVFRFTYVFQFDYKVSLFNILPWST